MKINFKNTLLRLVALSSFASVASAEICQYKDSSGHIFISNSLDKIPKEYQNKASCIEEKNKIQKNDSLGTASPGSSSSIPTSPTDARSSAQGKVVPIKPQSYSQAPGTQLALPQDIKLEGNIRQEEINSPLGKVFLRWPRNIESLFGRTPVRATVDALNTVNKAVKKSSFPSHLQNLNQQWQIIFLDEKLPETQIPKYLISACHPGWMTPPSNIYIVAQRIAGVCSPGEEKFNASTADKKLAEVLIHEIGHGVEFQLLKDSHGPHDRMRAEGFATWFTTYAAEFSSLVNKTTLETEYKSAAKTAITAPLTSQNFTGSYQDYTKAAMYFATIVTKRGLPSLIKVYEQMNKTPGSLQKTVNNTLSWNEADFEKAVNEFVKK